MAAALTALGLALAGPASASTLGPAWFWAAVPAKIEAGARTGAVAAVAAARADGRRTFGSDAQVRRIIGTWREELEAAAHASRLSEALLAALVIVESSGNDRAVSPAGAQGLGQLMPGTARYLGVRDSFHPTQNLRGAASYLSDLLDMFGGDMVLALAAYNAGEGAVMRHRGVPPFAETRAYVPKVLSAYLMVMAYCTPHAEADPATLERRAADPRAACPLPELS